MTLNKPALKFAFGDTVAALPLNMFLNFILISVGLRFEMSAAAITIMVSVVLFFVAMVRKYLIRVAIDSYDIRRKNTVS
jgi:hypothetical protein